MGSKKDIPSLKLTWPLKIDGWNTTFLLGRPIFRGHVRFREGKPKPMFRSLTIRTYWLLIISGTLVILDFPVRNPASTGKFFEDGFVKPLSFLSVFRRGEAGGKRLKSKIAHGLRFHVSFFLYLFFDFTIKLLESEYGIGTLFYSTVNSRDLLVMSYKCTCHWDHDQCPTFLTW